MEKQGKNEFISLKEIEETVKRFAKRIDAKPSSFPTFGYSIDLAQPYVLLDHDGYHYIITERGRELQRFSTKDYGQLLFYIFKDITASIALNFEANNRVKKKDPRRLSFAKQEELMGVLNPQWKSECQILHQQLLEEYPFDDNTFERAELCRSLREKGYPDEKAWNMACESFPLPDKKNEN